MNFFDTIIKRVNNFSVQSYEQNKDNLVQFFETNDLFKLCVLNASGSLYNDINKNKSEKTNGALANYFIRAHFNPTPFGVFNSVGVLHWDTTTDIPKSETLRLMVKYDNLFLSSKKNENISNEWQNLTYCTNPSIYFLNEEKIAFYKSKNQNKDKIETSYTEIDADEDLLWLLDQFKDGKKIDLVIVDLIEQGFERAEVESFLLEIIETGLIIETFLFDPFTNKLYNPFIPYLSDLVAKKEHLLKTKSDTVNFIQSYTKEQNSLFDNNNIPKDFYAINSFDVEKGRLDKSIQNKVKKYIDFSIHYNNQATFINKQLEKFITKVKEKYNEGFIPFNTIFNPYSGISYSALKTDNELKLHQDIMMKILTSKEKDLFLNMPVDENIDIKATKLPSTFNVVLETLVCKTSGESIIYIHGTGDPSSLNIISRFSDVTQEACDDIINYEKEVNKDKIIADINCVGNYRSINVGPTEQRYDYSLPINTSYNEESNSVFLSDVYVHLHQNTFSLVSKKHKKQILPKKVSAINQRLLESDIYNFLCDFESYNQEFYGVNFNFNAYKQRLSFIPRIYLEKGILMYPAQLLLVDEKNDSKAFDNYLKQKLKENSFSTKIVITERQRQVILDTEIQENVDLLHEKVKSMKQIYVSEFLYDFFDPEIKRGEENFAHELIVALKNPYYKRHGLDYSKMDISIVEAQNAAVISDWLYLELYCNTYADSEIFKTVENKIILENKADQFFFVNYGNPDRHIRLRFKTNSIENKQYIINIVHELKTRNIISKYHILPYEQEIYRYGGIEMMELSESIFNLDSRDFLTNIANNDLDEKTLDIIAILKIKNYLTFLGYTLDEMINNCENVIKNFSAEFELTALVRKSFNKDYAELKNEIDKYEYEDFLQNESLKAKFSENLKSKSELNLISYTWLLIHMSMNRHFKNEQRFSEFKIYYLTKCYLNQIKYKK